MELRVKQMKLRIDWLMLLLPFVAAALGEGRRIALMILSLTAHECGHLLTAAALRAHISRLRLTPFGAMAQIENPYAISAFRLLLIAAAGPLAGLIIALSAAAMCYWNILNAQAGAEIIQINLLMALFNLIPALPLDGGRMLYAILTLFIPRRRAMDIGIWSGRLLAAFLLLMTVQSGILHHRLNLSPVFVALFLLTSAQDERRALTDSRVRALVNCMKPIEEPMPVSLMAIGEQTSAETALQCAIPGRVTLYAVYEHGYFSKLIDDRTLLSQILDKTGEKNID